MAESEYRAQIEKAWQALVGLAAKRNFLTCEISKLRYLIVAHANMLSDEERNGVLEMLELIDPPVGMSSAILKILMNDAGDGFTATEIRQRLLDIGYDLSDQSNPLASIATTLRRMIPRDVVETRLPNAKRRYKYKWKIAVPLNPAPSRDKVASALLLEMRRAYLLAQRTIDKHKGELPEEKRLEIASRHSESGMSKR